MLLFCGPSIIGLP